MIKYRAMKILPALALFIILWPNLGWAADSARTVEWQGRIGLSVMEFGYKEFSADGHLLDREAGVLPGVAAALTRTQGYWFTEGELSYYSGQALYYGQTQSGAPFDTRTGENIQDYELRAGRWFGMRADSDLGIYAGLGYRRWARDIHSRSDVNGPSEVYDWWYGSLGTKWIFYKAGKLQGGIDLSLLRTIAPEIKIDSNDTYDNARLDLGERFGGRLSLPWSYRLANETVLGVEPYLEGWDLGRSPIQPLTRNSAVAGSIYEPRSETRNFGLTFNIIRSF
jgi:hypothetical protein